MCCCENINYEYEVVEQSGGSSAFQSDLNTLGSSGWSVVWVERNHSTGYYHALLKRKI